jgi:hypothetical protein
VGTRKSIMKVETSHAAHTARCRRGGTLIEFVLAGSFIFVPLLVGTMAVGMAMIRSIQVTALNRDAGHMFSLGLDFSQAANQNLLVKIAGDLNITPTGGDGVVILSEIVGTGTNQAVIAQRLVVGNSSLRASNYGTPDMIDSGGNVTPDASATATNFTPAVMSMVAGQVAYVAETYFSTSDVSLGGLLPNGIYVWAVF